MSTTWCFIFGFGLLTVLGAVAHTCLARDYRSRSDARVQSVAFVWAFSSVHFGLVALAAMKSTWHISLPTALRLGGGTMLVAIGAALCLGQVYVFRSLKRENFLDHTRLVTEGVYRWSRNPGLVGWTLVLGGLGIIRESAMVLFLTLVMCVGYGLHLPTEEKHLRRVFGEAYEAYRRRTPRYFRLMSKKSE